jgi:hypothetical protein
VITAAAICPFPPLLFRGLAGLQDPVADLRAAAIAAVRDLVAGAGRVVVVGPAESTGTWDASLPEDVRRFGTTADPVPSGLPLSLGVGRRLLRDAGWSGPVELHGLGPDRDGAVEALTAELAARPDGTVLLALGEGSARRGATAPGYLDERAFPFDDELARALAEGDARALRDLDAALAEELMVQGAAPFRLLGALALDQATATPPSSTPHPVPAAEPSSTPYPVPAAEPSSTPYPVPAAELTYRDDPFGVTYLVATWRLSR